MHTAVIVAPRTVELRRESAPEPRAKEVRVHLEGTGVCASSLPVWQGRPWFTYPLDPGAPGHEAWGTIDAVGASVGHVKIGDRVVARARACDRLLDVDLSYRFTDGLQKIYTLVREGQLGAVYAANLTFHNAYGPDKPWFYARSLSGGGCVVDLGVHLVDLALWMMGGRVANVSSRLFSEGVPWSPSSDRVEDFATARLDFCDGAMAKIACSWRLAAGRDAIIDATFYGTRGAARWYNVRGSFYDFVAERLDGTNRTIISEPPEDWGPRAIVRWGRSLATHASFDPCVERVLDVTRILDRMYSLRDDERPTRERSRSDRRAAGRAGRAG